MPRPNILLRLAAEGVVPILGAAAGGAANVAAGDAGPMIGMAVEKGIEKAVNIFGRGIVARWRAWFARRPQAEVEAAVSELAQLTAGEARAQARSILLELAPHADANELELAVEYLSAVPHSIDRALVHDPTRGAERSLPFAIELDDERSLLQLLPDDVPPFPDRAELPGTPYRLLELLGTGGFGAVYRASSPSLQHLPLAIKFCLDRSLLPTLNQERSNLERLMRVEGRGAEHVVRLYGYDLDHATPYLVYEYVAGGDLTHHLSARRAALGNNPDASEVLGWIIQIAEGLAFAHRAGLVHRDLKPANVLVDGSRLKLADFGIGGVAAVRAVARSRIGSSTLDYLSLADQASLFRGAGTPLYMSPEQRKGASPDPRHDLYALGVVWYQLLAGDVSRELHHGWAKELAVRYGVPAGHLSLIERCVGWFDDRPINADELLPLLREAAGMPLAPAEASPASPRMDGAGALESARKPVAADTATTTSAKTAIPGVPEGPRRVLATSIVNRLHAAHERLAELKTYTTTSVVARALFLGIVLLIVLLFSFNRIEFAGSLSSIFMGLGFMVVLFFAILWWMRVKLIEEEQIFWCVKELTSEFPELVADSGGKLALENPELVELLHKKLEPASTSPGSRQAVFGSLLARLEKAHIELGALAEWPLWETILWGFFPALAIGWIAGEIFFAREYPGHQFPAAFNSFIDWQANLFGVAAGLTVWIGYVLAIRTYVRPIAARLQFQIERMSRGLVRDFPVEVEAIGGADVLGSLPSVQKVRDDLAIPTGPPTATAAYGEDEFAADPKRRTLALLRFQDLDQTWHIVRGRLGSTWAFLVLLWAITIYPVVGGLYVEFYTRSTEVLVLIASIVVGLLVAWVEWEAMAAVRRAQRQRWENALNDVANEYPKLVKEWGGRNLLSKPDTIAAVLRSLDPTALQVSELQGDRR